MQRNKYVIQVDMHLHSRQYRKKDHIHYNAGIKQTKDFTNSKPSKQQNLWQMLTRATVERCQAITPGMLPYHSHYRTAVVAQRNPISGMQAWQYLGYLFTCCTYWRRYISPVSKVLRAKR